MELVANRRSFVYIPLCNHFEQNHQVVHRLRRSGAPDPTPYDEATPERLAAQMLEQLGATVAPPLEERKSGRDRTRRRRTTVVS